MAAADDPFRIEYCPDAIVISGDLDAHTEARVRDALTPPPGTGDVRVDVSGVSFIDSSGLRVVLELHQLLDRERRRLVLVDPSRPVARLIEVAGLRPHLHVEPPLEPVESVQRVGADR